VTGPLVSVVLPVFNGQRFLAQAIESVLAQTWSPVELVVVDDGSTDGSAEIARRYPVRYVHQENAGVAAARNRGIAESGGELVSFIDQDDLWLERKLELQVEALARDPEAGICVCRFDMFVEPGVQSPDWLPAVLLEESQRGYQVGTLLVRREVLDAVGGFDTSYFAANDTDWFLRTRELGVKVAVVDEPLQRYRVHDENASFAQDVLRREHMSAFRASVRRRRAERPPAP
jgi:glycosyltransferase involved in cell wall biosynthesis